MEIRAAVSPKDMKLYTTDRLREEFLIQNLFVSGKINLVYSQIDRMITGAAVPITPLRLEVGEKLRADYFLQRRELGMINIGGKGIVTVDGKAYELGSKDGLYIGMGSRRIEVASESAEQQALFYFISAPAHKSYPTVLIKLKDCLRLELGNALEANHRIITKYILPGQVESCQLVMGYTKLMPGSVWNTMPCHTHDRRMEVYLYFDMEEDASVFHYIGEPQETRHIIVRNREAVLSPSWSIHSGCGTRAYSFLWGMAGENKEFDDMDAVDIRTLR